MAGQPRSERSCPVLRLLPGQDKALNVNGQQHKSASAPAAELRPNAGAFLEAGAGVPADGGTEMCLPLLGRAWHLKRPASLDELWEAMTPEAFGADERLPYWAELWPSSLVLGAWLAEVKQDLAGRVCLDVGCGLGLTALIGAWLGGRVLAFDYEADAVRATLDNAGRNQVAGVAGAVADWRAPAFKAGAIARAWAGDIMYERRFARPVAAFLHHCLAPGGVFWLAEPCRPVYREFLALLRESGWSVRQAHEARAGFVDGQGRSLPSVPLSTVQIWELRKGG